MANDTSEAAPEWASSDQLRRSMRTLYAYFGRYELDCERRVVTHLVKADLKRIYTGTRQERPCHLSGHSLIIGVSPGRTKVFLRVR